jgi:UDP-N-acetylmuramate--alanine ligase
MQRIHFIGVSGIGVSAVAKISIASGFIVTGSADMRNELTASLQKEGMRFFYGHHTRNVVGADLVVKSAAVPETNPEILEARKRGIPVMLYAEYLGMLMEEKEGIAVAGTHGKTTTTAMLGQILFDAGLDPTVVCGGIMNRFSSNAVFGKGRYFVAEACEYNRSFLNLRKKHSVLLNIEQDHLDYYSGIEDIKQAFADFMETTDPNGFAVVNGDSEHIAKVREKTSSVSTITVGYGNQNRYRIHDEVEASGRYSFSIENEGKTIVRTRLPVPGRFNCLNAAVACVCALTLGVERDKVEFAISRFSGTKRRMEFLGKVMGSDVYTDYGHHPTEIRCTLHALKEIHPGKRLCVVFQPHQYSRTAALFDGFVNALGEAHCIIITDIYRQRDEKPDISAVKSDDLHAALVQKYQEKPIMLEKDYTRIPTLLCGLEKEREVIVFMGAGDIDSVARSYKACNV